jgi:hypothetical protein
MWTESNIEIRFTGYRICTSTVMSYRLAELVNAGTKEKMIRVLVPYRSQTGDEYRGSWNNNNCIVFVPVLIAVH